MYGMLLNYYFLSHFYFEMLTLYLVYSEIPFYIIEFYIIVFTDFAVIILLYSSNFEKANYHPLLCNN